MVLTLPAQTLLALSEESRSLCPASDRSETVQKALIRQRRAYDAEIVTRRAA